MEDEKEVTDNLEPILTVEDISDLREKLSRYKPWIKKFFQDSKILECKAYDKNFNLIVNLLNRLDANGKTGEIDEYTTLMSYVYEALWALDGFVYGFFCGEMGDVDKVDEIYSLSQGEREGTADPAIEAS